jgi:hypothetical protein
LIDYCWLKPPKNTKFLPFSKTNLPYGENLPQKKKKTAQNHDPFPNIGVSCRRVKALKKILFVI